MVAGDTRRRSSSSSETGGFESVRVRLIGVLGTTAGRREIDLQVSGPTTLSDLISILLKEVAHPQFQDFLIDSASGDPRPNVIILLNEQDCNVLEGLKTRVGRGSVVTIIPVAHGGTALDFNDLTS